MEHPGLSKIKKFRNREKGAKNIGTGISEIGVPTPIHNATHLMYYLYVSIEHVECWPRGYSNDYGEVRTVFKFKFLVTFY